MPLPRLVPAEEFFANPEFSAAVISPDGTKLAYLAPRNGQLQVWVRGIDETHDDAICLTDDAHGIHTFYWTDIARYLLYRQDTDGNEDWHFYRVDLENPDAPAFDLTPLPRGGRVLGGGRSKSHPGTWSVAMNPRVMFFDTYRIDIATGEQTLVRENNELEGVVTGLDGREDFFMKSADDGSYEYYAIDPDGSKRLLFAADGPGHPVGVQPTGMTPDGRSLLLGTYYEDHDQQRLIQVDHDGTISVVAEVPGESVCCLGMFSEDFGLPPSLFFSAKTEELIGVRFVSDRPYVKVVHPDYGELFAALQALHPGEIFSLSSSEDETKWVVTFIDDREPGVTFFYDRSTGESRELFRPATNADDFAPMQSVRFAARDGLPLHGFLTLPVGVEPVNLPMVLIPHGGPWAHDIWGFNAEVQFLANRGYAVLQVNFRGSTGYGRKHITGAIRELSGAAHNDLIDACEWAVALGYADPTRIGIYGGSYGGYCALVGVTFTPDYFAAAVDHVGVSSLVGFMESLPVFVRPHLQNSWMLYAGDPDDPDQRADMLARSPVTHLEKVVKPLLVIQGAMDARVAQSESDAIVEGLRARGVPVEYWVAPDEGHDFKKPENKITMYKLIEKHFAQHLGGRCA